MSTSTMSTSATISIPTAIRSAFATWLVSADNTNRTRLDDEKYLEYKCFLKFPKSTAPFDIKDKEAKQRWSNQKHDALTNYELVNGLVFRRACKIGMSATVSSCTKVIINISIVKLYAYHRCMMQFWTIINDLNMLVILKHLI